MEEEGIVFKCNANVGVNLDAWELLEECDAMVLCGGATDPRDLEIPGRELKGIHFAMDYLTQQNRRVAGREISRSEEILAKNKNVIVIGGGDTGSDCVGTANRQGARSITQLELLPKPPDSRGEDNPWPQWPMILYTSSSHDEGCDRHWSILTKEYIGNEKGNIKALRIADIEWKIPKKGEKPTFVEVNDSEREIPCDLVLLAVGFKHPEHNGVINKLGIELTGSGNVKDRNYQTNLNKVFTAGDMRRGQSLVVWAISEGREAARKVDRFLMGETKLESKDSSFVRIS